MMAGFEEAVYSFSRRLCYAKSIKQTVIFLRSGVVYAAGKMKLLIWLKARQTFYIWTDHIPNTKEESI